ncbi:MAG: CrcB family protein [Vicinamibacterales bacterium]
MRELLMVALGGAVGSVARLVTTGAVYRVLPATYPWGTTTVNLVGSFAFGLVVGWGMTRDGLSPEARALLLSGLLGDFTTFSAFSFETVELMAHRLLHARAGERRAPGDARRRGAVAGHDAHTPVNPRTPEPENPRT